MFGLKSITKTKSLALLATLWAVLFAVPASTAVVLDENCTVSILNRSVQVNPNGRWEIQNIPVQPGVFRVRATCLGDQETVPGQTVFKALIISALKFSSIE